MQETPVKSTVVANWFGCDLKTIHNWVNRGYLRSARTFGGHLRLLPSQLVEDCRRRGVAIPQGLLDATAETRGT